MVNKMQTIAAARPKLRGEEQSKTAVSTQDVFFILIPPRNYHPQLPELASALLSESQQQVSVLPEPEDTKS